METLNNYTLLYDQDCPLCRAYTKGFIKSKMLDNKGRKAFGKISWKEKEFIDVQRAVNEIALVNRKSGKVVYGIDSLLKIIGNSFPMIEKIGKINPVNFLLRKLYSFVSYNRKVIVPAEKKIKEIDCSPSFSFRYRFIYILFALLVSASIFLSYLHLTPRLQVLNFGSAMAILISQITFQSLFLANKDLKTIVNYIGNLATVLLIGGMAFLQALLLNELIPFPQLIIDISFISIVLLMFFEHKRRAKILEIKQYVSYTWLLFSVGIVLLLINL